MLKRDYIQKIVCEFKTEDPKDADSILIGTGFATLKEEKLYLITANHVARDFNPSTIVVFNGQNFTPKNVLLSTIQIGQIIKHQTADVCAIQIDGSVVNKENLDLVVFNPNAFLKGDNYSRDTELTGVGFPNDLGSTNNFNPLTFRSFPACSVIKNYPLDNGKFMQDILVLENPCCGGYSGGPVIDLCYVASYRTVVSNEEELCVYGVLHGNFFDKTGAKMTIVTPAHYIFDLI